MKAWRDHCSVPLKSFLLEMLVAEFVSSYVHREQGFFYYDWFVRDFLAYVIRRKNGQVVAPNSGEAVWLGEAWASKAETAYRMAVEACDNEYHDYTALAGGKWQKIFGGRIPVLVG